MLVIQIGLLILCGVLREMETARILAVFPVPSVSHQAVFRPVTQELARRGHEVVVLTPNPAFTKGNAPENLTEIDMQALSYSLLAKNAYKCTDLSKAIIWGMEIFIEVFDAWLGTDAMKRILTGEKFDLLLVESCVRATVALSHVLKLPTVQISSYGAIFQNYQTFGAPTHPYLYPSAFQKRLYNLAFWEKVTNFLNYLDSDLLYIQEEEDKMLKKHFGQNLPHLRELYSNVDMLFLNEHSIWSGNTPVPLGVTRIWGIHQTPKRELPQELKVFLNSSTQGVIYFSLGSNVKSYMLPSRAVEAMTKVLSELPYNVLWKWDLDKLPGEPKNIKLSQWFPQPDVLRHPNVKLFITQGGLQSTDEGIRGGVPFVAIPFFFDQFYNAEKYDKLKIGKYLYRDKITEDNFREAVQTVINDQTYKNNVVRLRAQLYDQPQPPLERAVWWIEHVLRHGGAKHLRAAGANVPWTQYYELELIAVVAAILCTVSIVLALSLRFVSERALRTMRGKKFKKLKTV